MEKDTHKFFDSFIHNKNMAYLVSEKGYQEL